MSISAPSLDLAPLYRHCLFRSDVSVDSHAQVAQELSDHDLRWKRGVVDTAMFKASARQLQMFMLRYGPEVEVRPRPFRDFALVHLSLKGTAEMLSDGRRVAVPQGRAAVLAPRRDLRMWWARGSEQLILKVPHALLRAVSDAPDGSVDLPSVLLLPTGLDAQWRLLMQSLLHASAIPASSPAHAAWVDHFERGIAMFMLAARGGLSAHATPSAAADDADDAAGEAARAEGSDEQRIRAVHDCIERRLGAPIGLLDMARAAGVSVRTLHALWRRPHGLSPMELLRNARRDAVRARLRSRSGVPVTQIALEAGFGHLGRFSAYYRARFGELPSQTGGPRPLQ
jgi:AraC-like DNA-binding protein